MLWSLSKVKYSYATPHDNRHFLILSNANQDTRLACANDVEMDFTEGFTAGLRGVTGM